MKIFMKFSTLAIGNKLFSTIKMISITISIQLQPRNTICILKKTSLRLNKISQQVKINTFKII